MSKVFDWNGHKYTIKAMPYISPVDPPKKCEKCNGTGKIFDNFDYVEIRCEKCFGNGNERIYFPDPVMDLKLCKYLNDCLDEYLKDKVLVNK